MKKKFILISCFFLLFSCTNLLEKKPHQKIAVSQEFVQGSEDIPLLIGMERVSEDSLGFDSASGSIISSSYTTKIQRRRVRNFYLKTLPQMGWQIIKNVEKGILFKRENEKLEIEFSNNNGQKIVVFFISSVL